VVALILVSWISIRNSWMRIHFLSGYGMVTALLFRLGWGFVGSQTARFSSFLGSPGAALRHLARLRRREPDSQVGHNPAGGWMVLVMLLVLAVQATTGLCANDDIMTQGPLADLVGKPVSDRLSVIHAANFKLILAIGLLHVLAIAAYAVLKGHNLVRPMITGRKTLPAGQPAPRMATTRAAAAVLAVAAAIVIAIAAGR
jgi:cytochrome b